MNYRFGFRVERSIEPYVGIGVTSITEVALVLSLLFWDVYIGKVYDVGA